MLFPLIYSFFWGSHICICQTPIDSTQEKISKIEAKINILNENLEIVLKENEAEYTGRIRLYSIKVPVYLKDRYVSKAKTDKGTSQEATLIESIETNIIIDSIEISISDGVIAGIRVFNKFDIYESIHSIALQNFNKTILSVFIYDIKNNNRFLRLTDFLQYLPKIGQNFLPDDIDFTLTKADTLKQKLLTAGVDLNSFIELQINTDFLSIFNNQPNGLIQTEAKTRFLLYTVPNQKNGYSFNYLEASFKYSKFDSKFEFLEINDSIEPIYFDSRNRLLLNQYSFLNLGLKLNIYKIKYPRFLFEFNIGLKYDLTNINYSKPTDRKQIDLFSFFSEVQFGVLRSKNFGFNTGFIALGQFISNRNIEIVRPTTMGYFIPSFSAFYYPKDDKSNKIFLEFRTMTDFGTAQFINFQVGYSSKIALKK